MNESESEWFCPDSSCYVLSSWHELGLQVRKHVPKDGQPLRSSDTRKQQTANHDNTPMFFKGCRAQNNYEINSLSMSSIPDEPINC